MIILDRGRRMTVACMINKLAPGIIGATRSDTCLRAIDECFGSA